MLGNTRTRGRGLIILISNSYVDASSIKMKNSVHAFGIHGAHDAKELFSLAINNRGVYAVLNDELGRITEAFASSIYRLTSIVAVQMRVKFLRRWRLIDIDFVAAWKNDKEGTFPVHHRGATRNLVWYVEGLQEHQYNDLPAMFVVELSYCRAATMVRETVHGQVLVVRKGDHASKELAAAIVLADAFNFIVLDIFFDGYRTLDLHKPSWDELESAADDLRNRWRKLQSSDHGREATSASLISVLAKEMREMEIRLRSNSFWLEYVCSWLGHRTQQQPLTPMLMGNGGPDTASFLRPRVVVKQLVDTVSTKRLPVLVHVVAPSLGKMDRAHIDVIAVLDVRFGAMKPTSSRMKLVQKAIELVMDRLSDKDRLAVIPVHSSDAQPNVLLEMSLEGRSATSAKIRSLSAAPDKNKALQASHGKEPLKEAVKKFLTCNCLPIAPENQQSTSDMTRSLASEGSTKLWNALRDAVKLLEDRHREDIDRVGQIILISDYGNSSSTINGNLSTGYTVHAFGFRDGHNAMAMYRIASSSGGIYAVLDEDDDHITEAFAVCIHRITSIVANQTQIDIKCNEWSSATLSAIESGQIASGISHDRKLGYVRLGNLHHGAMWSFIIYLDNVREDEHQGFTVLFTARVRYSVAGWMDMEQDQVYLLTPEDDPEASADVAAEIVRAQAVEMVRNVANKYDAGGVALKDKRFQVVDELHEGWRRLKGSKNAQAAGEARLVALAQDIAEMEARLLRDSGLPFMLSWLSFQKIPKQLPSKSEVDRNEDSAGNGDRQPGLPPLQFQH